MIGSSTAAEPSITPAPVATDDEAGGRKIAAATFDPANMTGASRASRNHFQASAPPRLAPGATINTTPANPNSNPMRPSQRNRSMRASTLIVKVKGGDSASTSVITPAGSFGAM